MSGRLRIWVTGAGGLIGSHLVRAAKGEPFVSRVDCLPHTRQTLDLAEASRVARAFREESPDAIIHCAALSRSPDCQANPALAHTQNVEVTRILADLAGDIPLVFFSTDLVFDGLRGDYRETEAVNPLSVYARTKVEAERIVRAHPRHLVIRTSLNGGTSPTGDRGFNEQMRLAWRAGRRLSLFTDEFRCPIAAEVTARATWELLLGGRTGVFHVAGAERLSRWEIGQLLAARAGDLTPNMVPGTLRDYQGDPRAPDTSLNCEKAQAFLSFKLPGLTEWLAQHPAEVF